MLLVSHWRNSRFVSVSQLIAFIHFRDFLSLIQVQQAFEEDLLLQLFFILPNFIREFVSATRILLTNDWFQFDELQEVIAFLIHAIAWVSPILIGEVIVFILKFLIFFARHALLFILTLLITQINDDFSVEHFVISCWDHQFKPNQSLNNER